MYVTGFDRVWVPVLMPDFVLKFKLYVVERDQDIIDQIVDTCTTFWEGNVLAGVCPEGCLPAQRTLKRLKRVPSKVVEVDSVLVKEYESARKVSAEAKGVEKEARVRLIQALGDGEVGTYNGGHVEYSLRTRKGVGGAPDTNYRMLKVRESHDGST
jgi:predicted phage-related endonuclease